MLPRLCDLTVRIKGEPSRWFESESRWILSEYKWFEGESRRIMGKLQFSNHSYTGNKIIHNLLRNRSLTSLICIPRQSKIESQ